MEVCVFLPGTLDWNPDEGKWNLERKPPTRNYTTISISENADENRIKLDYAGILLKEQNTRHDTLSGVHFRLTEKCRYTDFVAVANLQLDYPSLDFFMNTRDIWVTEVVEKKHPYPAYQPFCSTSIMRCLPERIDHNVPPHAENKILIVIMGSFVLLVGASVWKNVFNK